jgi:deoxyribonuclease V
VTARPGWPSSAEELRREQARLAELRPPPWRPEGPIVVAGCFVCFPRGSRGPGRRGDRAWAAAVAMRGSRAVGRAIVTGAAGAPYEAGLLALREGPLLAEAVRALATPPDVVLVDATGRDHPRGAGLALHLGAVLDLPTVGVTHRPLLADGQWPEGPERGASAALTLEGVPVGLWLRTRAGARPLAIHPGWRADIETARAVVLASLRRARTPEPLRGARHEARLARAGGMNRSGGTPAG